MLTLAEAAELATVHRSTVLRWVGSGLLPSYRVGVRSLRVRRDDLERLIVPARARSAGAHDGAPLAPLDAGAELLGLARELRTRLGRG